MNITITTLAASRGFAVHLDGRLVSVCSTLAEAQACWRRLEVREVQGRYCETLQHQTSCMKCGGLWSENCGCILAETRGLGCDRCGELNCDCGLTTVLSEEACRVLVSAMEADYRTWWLWTAQLARAVAEYDAAVRDKFAKLAEGFAAIGQAVEEHERRECEWLGIWRFKHLEVD